MGIRKYPPEDSSTTGNFPDWTTSHVRIAMVNPAGAIPHSLGFNPASIGAPAVLAPSGTNAVTSLYRLNCGPVGAAATIGTNLALAAYWRGNAAGLGGFTVEWIWGSVGRKATGRLACGLFTGVGAIALAGDPSAFLNCLFFGEDAGDANLQFMCNDAAGVCTKVDCGANFAKANANRMYRASIFCGPNAASVDWSITDLTTGAVASGNAAANIPGNTVFLGPQFACGGGTGAGNNAAVYTRLTAQCPY